MAAVRKVDLLAIHRGDYAAPRSPRVVTVGKGQYLAVAGRGRPGDAPFRAQAAALRAVARAIRAVKRRAGKDFRIMPLEGLWWGRSPAAGPAAEAEWSWKLLLRVPSFVRGRDLALAAAALAGRGPGERAGEVRLEVLEEGRCVQALHVGPPATEGETLERMTRAARAGGLALHGRHHEIYVSDPRRVPPERMRTILRRPARAAR